MSSFSLWGTSRGERLRRGAAGVLSLLALSVGWVGVTPASAQGGKTMLVEPPRPLLPARLGGLTKAAAAPVGDGLGQIDPAQAAVFHEDGIKRFERSEYTSATAHATLTAYQFFDASGAYAAFCFQRKPGMPAAPRPVGDAAVVGPDGLVFQSGINLVVAKFDGPAAQTNALLPELIAGLPKVAGPAAQAPSLPTYLPAKGLMPASVRYALGPVAYTQMGGILPADILLFGKSGEAVTAEYAGHGVRGGGKGVLTLLLYPTPTIAGDAGRAILERLKAEPQMARGMAQIRREGPMLMLATGGFSDAEGQAMLGGIHLRNELTWNKPMPLEFHAEVRKTASLLTSIMVFSGVAGLAAILLGLFLGGARAGIRVLMGKPAASEPEFLRIDLSGTPARGLDSGLGDGAAKG